MSQLLRVLQQLPIHKGLVLHSRILIRVDHAVASALIHLHLTVVVCDADPSDLHLVVSPAAYFILSII